MRLIACLLGVGAFLSMGQVQADWTDIERSFDVNAGGTLYLDTQSGGIRVESHDSNTVEVKVEARGSGSDDFTVDMRQSGDDVKIRGKRKGSSWGWSMQSMFTIMVPKNYNLDLKTSGGSIDISDLIGTIDAHTSGGSIELGNIQGDVDIKTSGGSIRVDEVAGNIRAHTSGGSIRTTISKQPTDDSRLKTSGGSITAYLAEDIAVDLSASTSGGRVKSEFDVSGSIEKTRISGKINGGGPELFLRTSGGSVKIKKL